MKATVLSNKTKTVVYRTEKLKVGKFTVTNGYTDEVLVSQNWSIKGGFKNTHKSVHDPKSLHFHYYDDISFLDSDEPTGYTDWYKIIPKNTLVEDWDTFKGLDHVLCIWVSMDGNIYRIDRATPIPTWRHQDYTGGFQGDRYRKLSELAEELKAIDFIRNVEIIDVPYYNGGGKAVEFDYKLPVRVFDTACRVNNPLVRKIANKYLKPEDERDY